MDMQRCGPGRCFMCASSSCAAVLPDRTRRPVRTDANHFDAIAYLLASPDYSGHTSLFLCPVETVFRAGNPNAPQDVSVPAKDRRGNTNHCRIEFAKGHHITV